MVKNERCAWAGTDPLMIEYHDNEWGIPVRDERAMFERLMLEAFQAGLSWRVVLHKREAMRERFYDFDPRELAAAEHRIEDWCNDPAVIRNRAKLNALVHNARVFLSLDDPIDLIWSVTEGNARHNRWQKMDEIPDATPEAHALSKLLKQNGFKFVGPVVCYALMQSAGLVNDHVVGCPQWKTLAKNEA